MQSLGCGDRIALETEKHGVAKNHLDYFTLE